MIATAILIAWCWTTDIGTFSCTDTQKNIPARYAGSAYKLEIGVLADYPRLTIDQTQAPAN